MKRKPSRKIDPSTLLRVRTDRVTQLDGELKELFPNAHIALKYRTPWDLLVAVILSAQCTDVMVNKVTRTLFKKYPNLKAYCEADLAEFEQDIRSTGFYRMKAKHILASAKRVRDEYEGHVPRIMSEILTLPGVARKTANVVLANGYDIVEGIAVDTHVRRFAIRYDLTDYTDPVRIERDLMKIVPREDWMGFTYRVIEYGRQIAPARVYDLSTDPLIQHYPQAGTRFRV